MSEKHKHILQAKLEKLRETYSGLKKLQALTLLELENEYDKLWVVGFGFVVAIEAVVDIGQEILSEINTKAESYNMVLQKLSEHSVISAKLFDKTKGMTAFRNRLIHSYPSLDIEMVYTNLQERVDDFHEFIECAVAYIEALRENDHFPK